MYLAIDPGAGFSDTIGVAKFDATGNMVMCSQMTLPQFIPFLEGQTEVTHVVYEEYKIRRGTAKKHTGSKVETIQTIGAIKSWCMRNKVPFTEQSSQILTGAESLFQIKMPVDHRQSHQVSALLHGMFYLYNMGIIKSALEMEIEKRGK